MAETRMIKTRIWSDGWFAERTEEAQRLYIYLITNKNTRICGYYELPLFEICAHMRWDEKKVQKYMAELEPKVFWRIGWVYISNYPAHQNVANNPKVQAAIEKELKTVPLEILNLKSEIINHKSVAMDSPSIPYTEKEETDEKTNKNKEIYGEFGKVKLTGEEYLKLVEKLGERNTKVLIDELDAYIASKGKKYSSHYATILTWARRKVQEHVQNQRSQAGKPKMI